MSHTIDIKGQTFGSLEVIEYVGAMKGNGAYWNCRCLRCGGLHIAASRDLRSGSATRCRSCRLKDMSEEKRQLIREKPPVGGGRPALSRKMTRIEKSYRKMLAAKERLEVNNNIRLNNFTEIRLYDRLIGRDVDKMTQGMMG